MSDKLPDNIRKETISDDEQIDPTLDVSSELFDPLKALYAKHIKLPYENAKTFDNICQFQTYLNKQNDSSAGSKNDDKNTKLGKTSDNKTLAKPSTSRFANVVNEDGSTNIFQRRFLPHQSKLF